MTDVSTQTDAVNAMCEDWDLIEALLGGTKGMRIAGEKYLPKRPLEEATDYAIRLRAATLFPAFTETLKALVGRVFAEPVVYEKVPKWIESEVLPDVDRQGRSFEIWAREWFRGALGYGLHHVLIDSPQAAGVRTQEDQRKAGIRPYLVAINPRRILGWKETNGVLTQVRIRFCKIEDDGPYATKEIEQVRVYEQIGQAVTVQTHQRDENGKWLPIDAPLPLDIKRIPLITLYAHRTGMLTAEPPLRELGHLNAKHWRMQSGNDTLVDTAQVPILAASGIDDTKGIVIGAKHAVMLPQGADLKYVEHTGAAIGSGRTALLDIVEEMRQSGAKLIRRSEATKTAAEAKEDAVRDNSDLGAMARQLQDTLIDVLDLIAEWRSEPKGGLVKLNPNLEPDIAPAGTMTALQAMYRDNVISAQTVFGCAQKMGLLPDDLDWEDEQARVGEQGPAMPKPAVPAAKPGSAAA